MRSIFCGRAAGALFLALFLGIGWNLSWLSFWRGGLFLGLSLITKPKKIQGKIPLDMRPDAAYLKERLEEAKEDFDSIRRSMEKIQDQEIREESGKLYRLLPIFWRIWKKIRTGSPWREDLSIIIRIQPPLF